jgi:hypothetical protein
MLRAELVVNEPYLDRVPTVVDYSLDIQAYDEDNLYPQRAEFTRDRSFTAKTATKRYAGFIYGMGFKDKALAELVINRHGQTGNDLLRFISKDYSLFTAYALHFNYNLNYRISEINLLKFKFARFGTTNKYGVPSVIAVSNNWEQNPYKSKQQMREIIEYPVFSLDPEKVKQQVAAYGGIKNFPGAVHVITPELYVYPAATLDAVWDYAQVQKEIGVFDVTKVQQGLTATTLFKYPGTFDTDDDKSEFQRKLSAFKGAKGANSMMVIEDPGGTAKGLTESIQLQNLDKLHTDLNKNAKDSIRESYSQPAEIHGTTPAAGMFNKKTIQEAYTYYNTIVQEDRDAITRELNKVFTQWHKGNSFNAEISEKTYGSGQSAHNESGSSEDSPDSPAGQ